jgi:hypothetical protein
MTWRKQRSRRIRDGPDPRFPARTSHCKSSAVLLGWSWKYALLIYRTAKNNVRSSLWPHKIFGIIDGFTFITRIQPNRKRPRIRGYPLQIRLILIMRSCCNFSVWKTPSQVSVWLFYLHFNENNVNDETFSVRPENSFHKSSSYSQVELHPFWRACLVWVKTLSTIFPLPDAYEEISKFDNKLDTAE